MKSHILSVLAVAVAGLSFAAAGCLLGADPNHNSMIFGGVGGSGAGVAGATGSGGGGGMSGGVTGPVPGTSIATFESTIEGFSMLTYHDSTQTNLFDSTLQPPPNPPPSLTFDANQGNPSPGSLSVFVPYSGASQLVDIEKSLGATNWTGKTLHVRIKVTTGVFKGGAQLYVKTGGGYTFGGFYAPLAVTSAWQDVSWAVGSPMMPLPGYDPAQVVAFGLGLNSSSAGQAQTPVTFNIDSFSVDPPFPAVDAGTTTDTAAPTDDAAAPVDSAPPSDAAGN